METLDIVTVVVVFVAAFLATLTGGQDLARIAHHRGGEL